MKKLILLALMALTSTQALAQLPLCNSSEVRLSIKNPSCIGKFPPKFDLPQLGLQFGDLEKIILGSESSGGHGITDPTQRPVNGMWIQMATHQCQARFVIDGGKRVSWLLSADFALSSGAQLVSSSRLWRGGVVEGNDIEATALPVATLPSWGLDQASILVSDESLQVCIGENCALSIGDTQDFDIAAQLNVVTDQARMKLRVSCTPL